MTDAIAEGFWCTSCDYYEDDEMEGARCRACGCPENSHIAVKVVEA